MNFQQLEYIIALDETRHFGKAAEKSFVTQPTLSAMIMKLEEELGVKIFDRSSQPVLPTELGQEIILQARKVLAEALKFKDIVDEHKGQVKGEIRIGVIPTVAPFLLPLFLKRVMEKYPNLRLVVSEQTTDQIIEKLETNQLDAGIMATPLANHKLIELPLYKENFVVYSGPGALQHNGDYILARDIDLNRLWLLEEGHCLRNQVINLCELKKASKKMNNLEYEAGSIDSLIRIVDANDGVTIIPELASLGFTAKAKTRLQYFFPPAPNREISLVTYRYYVKDRLIDLLRSEIKSAVQPFFGKKEYAEPALSPILG